MSKTCEVRIDGEIVTRDSHKELLLSPDAFVLEQPIKSKPRKDFSSDMFHGSVANCIALNFSLDGWSPSLSMIWPRYSTDGCSKGTL